MVPVRDSEQWSPYVRDGRFWPVSTVRCNAEICPVSGDEQTVLALSLAAHDPKGAFRHGVAAPAVKLPH